MEPVNQAGFLTNTNLAQKADNVGLGYVAFLAESSLANAPTRQG